MDAEGGLPPTLFSAGGRDNADLRAESTYRDASPMALTIAGEGGGGSGGVRITRWAPDWASYNDPERNAFFEVAPEIPQRALRLSATLSTPHRHRVGASTRTAHRR